MGAKIYNNFSTLAGDCHLYTLLEELANREANHWMRLKGQIEGIDTMIWALVWKLWGGYG